MNPYKNTPAGPAMEESLERIKTCFGSDGRTKMACDNLCNTMIDATTFSVFMLPESEKFKILFVCRHCALALYHKYNYGNKN